MDQTCADVKAFRGQRYHPRVCGFAGTVMKCVVEERPTDKLTPTLKTAFEKQRELIIWLPFETTLYYGWEMAIPSRTMFEN
jgi:hypothetical protein